MTLRRLAGVAAVLGALMGIGPAVAAAHPLFVQAAPTPGLVAPSAPPTISIALSESAVARGSRFTVTRLIGGARVPVSAVRASGDGRTLSVTPRRRLASAVYRVRWTALGDDGHIVAGTFDFGVAGAKGAAPPGAERLTGTLAGGRGAEDAVTDSFIRILGRWFGVLSAAFLLGAFVLLWRLGPAAGTLAVRAADADDAVDASEDGEDEPRSGAQRLADAAPLAWLGVLLAAVEGVFAGATSGAGDSLDFGLLTASASGKADLARLIIVVVVSGALLALRTPAVRRALYAGGGLLVLGSYAISGHVLSQPSFWSVLDQTVHVLAAGLWLGGLLAIIVITVRGAVPLLAAARAFAPVAGGALGVAIVTGVLAAVREVDRWYFLRWSDYGRVVIIKSIAVALVAVLGAIAFWRTRSASAGGDDVAGAGAGAGGPRLSLVRVEAAAVVGVLALAATLSGLAQGRGQPLPAQRGSLFTGPAFATALLPSGGAGVTLAPARTGANVVAVSFAPEDRPPQDASVRLVRAGGGAPVRAQLRPGPSATTWSATVSLPADGTWYGYVTVDGKSAAPVQLGVGVPGAKGASPLPLVAVADLTGRGAERCRSHIIGVSMAVARINGDGGLDDGRKVALNVLDTGGTAAGAARATREALSRWPSALATIGACGDGAVSLVEAASKARIPSLVGDATIAPTSANGVFRLSADPYAQGISLGQLIRSRVQPSGVPGVSVVRVIAGRDAYGQRLVAGLRAGVQPGAVPDGVTVPASIPVPRIEVLAPGALRGKSNKQLDRFVTRTRTTAVVLDGPGGGGVDAQAIARLGRDIGELVTPGPILASERVLSEPYVRSTGSLGRIGSVQGVSEVTVNGRDAVLYLRAVQLLFRGELGSLDGLRGYITGLALIDGLRDGATRDALRKALAKPDVFSDSLLAPWSSAQSGRGSTNTVAIQPTFLSPTLIPARVGGEDQDSTYFPEGRWTVTSGSALGLSAKLTAPRIP